MASNQARRRKSRKPVVSAFDMDLEKNIWQLHDELMTKTYKPGPYYEFTIHEYKTRLISAAPYRDRVMHHAICNIIEPIFERSFIFDSYACRKDKGTHKAVDRYTKFSRHNIYVLKCDIRKYFPSIDLEILKSILFTIIKDEDVQWLIRLIIDGSNPQIPIYEYFYGDDLFTPFERRRGIPIGNLTSQFFANVYLNGLDHFIKENLHCHFYIRYCDDFVIFHNDKNRLHEVKDEIVNYLEPLRLKLHAKKCHIMAVKSGIDFLGYRVFPDHRLLREANGYRFQRKIPRLIKQLSGTETEQFHASQSVRAWIAHASHADTYGLQRALLKDTPFNEMLIQIYNLN